MKVRPLLVLLLTLGVLWGCETIDPLTRDARNALQTFDFEAAVEAADQAIQEDSTNALAYYYKGSALGSIAEDLEPPSDRKPYYEDMRESFDNAKRFGEEMDRRPKSFSRSGRMNIIPGQKY